MPQSYSPEFKKKIVRIHIVQSLICMTQVSLQVSPTD